MIKKIIACLCAVLLHTGMSAYIYEVKVLRRWNADLNKYQFFIGCSDFHDKSSEANSQQLTYVHELLSGCNKQGTKIIVEDLSSAGAGGRFACGRFAVNSRGGFLGGLAENCRKQGFDVENIEYRYCRVSALGPVLNNLTKDPHELPSVRGIHLASLAYEVDTVLQEIEEYCSKHEAPQYQHSIKQVQAQVEQWKHKACCDLTVAHYVEQYSTQANRLELLKHWLTFDSSLLDVKLVHTAKSTDADVVLAFSGGAHIERSTEDMVQNHGFELLYATDVRYRKEFDLSKCLGSTIIDGSYALRPEPIELSVVRSYL